MTRVAPDVCEDLGFSFVLCGHGWNDVHVACGRTSFTCRVSEIFSDTASELAKLCRGILTNTSTSIALYDEPGGHIISVITDEKQQHTMLLVVHELGPCLGAHEITGEETLVCSVRIKRKQLLGLLMAELWKNYHFLQEPSFQKSRGGRVPASALRALNDEWDAHKSLGPSFLK